MLIIVQSAVWEEAREKGQCDTQSPNSFLMLSAIFSVFLSFPWPPSASTNLTSVLYIPVQLIWKVKIKLSQKLTLSCSLCLTIIVIIFTITRASGLEWHGKLDVLWEVYFQIISAEAGLILVSMTAFRALFVSRSAAKPQRSPHMSYPTFWSRSKSSLRKLFDLRGWSTLYRSKNSSGQEKLAHTYTEDSYDLPNNIPGGTMTGVQTFINDQGQNRWSGMENVGYPHATNIGQAA